MSSAGTTLDHAPCGDPCDHCGSPAARHRPPHPAEGDPCIRCGLAATRHRVPRTRAEHSPDGDPCSCGRPARQHRMRLGRTRKPREGIYYGLDGEGQGRAPHRYVLLQAAEEDDAGRVWWVADENGLGTERCLDFLVNLPSRRASGFGFALSYDWTKILEDLPNEDLYRLFRPELRRPRDPKKPNTPIRWRGYAIDWMGGRVTIRKGDRKVTFWDVFKFYGTAFVKALTAWKVGTPAERAWLQLMKDQREDFDHLSFDEVRRYCELECRRLAQMVRKLTDAHEAVDLQLKAYHGAGSSGGAMLTAMGIRDQIEPVPEVMRIAVAMAFFGGRFENSVCGPIPGPVWNADISSAYPYQLVWLPCVLHGTWEWTADRAVFDAALHALAQYELEDDGGRVTDWAPFPFRDTTGSICYPAVSGGGYVWQDEFREGERLWPNVVWKGAWVHRTACTCRPFAKIPTYYLARIRLGKDGPGLVIKLAMNSCYGKIAQSLGSMQFNQWIWAGLITSGTRAQFLHLLGRLPDRRAMLMIATDGGYLTHDLTQGGYAVTPFPDLSRMPQPHDTGTWTGINEKGEEVRKPLGGWEVRAIPQGVFCARPGIYFPLDPTDQQLDDVRARGVGKAVVLREHRRITAEYATNGMWKHPRCQVCGAELGGMQVCGCGKKREPMTVRLANVARFCGAKSSIRRVGPPGGPYRYLRADGTGSGQEAKAEGHQFPLYGDWIKRPVDMTFAPMPKRAGVAPDGRTLLLRRLPRDRASTPYKKALRSPEAEAMQAAEQELLEQPNADFADYGIGEDE